MPNVKQAAAEFLANKRIAVTGVSRNPKGGHGSNIVYQRLRQRGYQVVAVNPNADTVEGDRCYPDLGSIPGGVDAVVIGTRPELAEATMRECAELGISQVWDAPRPRGRQRLGGGRRLRPPARHPGDRWGLPVDVWSHRRRWAQGDAAGVHADR
jgi:predicted CoA-binding protein